MTPPAVVIDDDGAEVQFDGVAQWHIRWSQVREIVIEVMVIPELDYSEAYWNLTGEGIDFVAPFDLIVGSDAFNARLFAFPAFDHKKAQSAREAEATGKGGVFVCWRAGPIS